MYHYGYDFGWWGFPFFSLLWPILWIVVIVFLFGRGRRWSRYHHEAQSDKSAEEILADRYAHGEIDEKEYEKRLAVLRRNNKSK